MRRAFSTLIVPLAALSLASCASVPADGELTAGIAPAQMVEGDVKRRLETDPVCGQFYDNVANFDKTAKKPSRFEHLMGVVGVRVASAVITDKVARNTRGRTKRIAAYTAVGTATSYGGHMLLNDLQSTKRADKKIIATAHKLGCPI